MNLDAETALQTAREIATLMSWIEEARSMLDRVRDAAGWHPGLAAALDEAEIPYRSPDWHTDQSEALSGLIRLQWRAMRELEGAIEQRDAQQREELGKKAAGADGGNTVPRLTIIKPEI